MRSAYCTDARYYHRRRKEVMLQSSVIRSIVSWNTQVVFEKKIGGVGHNPKKEAIRFWLRSGFCVDSESDGILYDRK